MEIVSSSFRIGYYYVFLNFILIKLLFNVVQVSSHWFFVLFEHSCSFTTEYIGSIDTKLAIRFANILSEYVKLFLRNE